MSQPKIDPTQITLGTVNGVASLDATGKLTTAQIPTALVGAIVFKGTWNATTNTPTITSGVGTAGWEYIVAVAGTTLIDGNSTWNIGDTIIFNGTVWQRIVGSSVQSVSGTTSQITASSSTGNIVLSLANPINVGTTGNAATATSATTSTNITGGSAGNLIYQTGSGATNFVAAGTATYILQANGASSPTWTNTPTLASITFADTSAITTAVANVFNPVAVTTASHTILATEDYVGVNFAGAVALTLNTVNNKKVVIKDESFAAATPGHTITITPSTGLIEGQANVTITVNGMSLTFICRAGNWFII